MGDAAMTVPVIKNLLNQHPDVKVTVVSDGFFAPIFSGIERCAFISADLKGKHKGIAGLYSLAASIKKQHKINAVADLHDVLRSYILRKFFLFTKTAVIDKGRAEKKKLARKNAKILTPLKSTHQRYADVFSALGYAVELKAANSFKPVHKTPALLQNFQHKKRIGIAPFAKHKGKTYPYMEQVVAALSQHNHLQLFLLGGKSDAPELEKWAAKYEHTLSIAGKYSFEEELHLISYLDVMVSMDSANMHLASLYNVPVISVWGATHPFAGFTGWQQPPENIVQAELFCRPCSVFGNKPCYRENYECMHIIRPSAIVEKMV